MDEVNTPCCMHLRRIGRPSTRQECANIMCFNRPVTIIGRNMTDVDYTLCSRDLLQNVIISRIHARVVRTGNEYRIHDDSRNGIFVNHTKIAGSAVLQEGDSVTFGHVYGENLPPGTWIRQPESEYRFIFEGCRCQQESSRCQTPNVKASSCLTSQTSTSDAQPQTQPKTYNMKLVPDPNSQPHTATCEQQQLSSAAATNNVAVLSPLVTPISHHTISHRASQVTSELDHVSEVAVRTDNDEPTRSSQVTQLAVVTNTTESHHSTQMTPTAVDANTRQSDVTTLAVPAVVSGEAMQTPVAGTNSELHCCELTMQHQSTCDRASCKLNNEFLSSGIPVTNFPTSDMVLTTSNLHGPPTLNVDAIVDDQLDHSPQMEVVGITTTLDVVTAEESFQPAQPTSDMAIDHLSSDPVAASSDNIPADDVLVVDPSPQSADRITDTVPCDVAVAETTSLLEAVPTIDSVVLPPPFTATSHCQMPSELVESLPVLESVVDTVSEEVGEKLPHAVNCLGSIAPDGLSLNTEISGTTGDCLSVAGDSVLNEAPVETRLNMDIAENSLLTGIHEETGVDELSSDNGKYGSMPEEMDSLKVLDDGNVTVMPVDDGGVLMVMSVIDGGIHEDKEEKLLATEAAVKEDGDNGLILLPSVKLMTEPEDIAMMEIEDSGNTVVNTAECGILTGVLQEKADDGKLPVSGVETEVIEVTVNGGELTVVPEVTGINDGNEMLFEAEVSEAKVIDSELTIKEIPVAVSVMPLVSVIENTTFDGPGDLIVDKVNVIGVRPDVMCVDEEEVSGRAAVCDISTDSNLIPRSDADVNYSEVFTENMSRAREACSTEMQLSDDVGNHSLLSQEVLSSAEASGVQTDRSSTSPESVSELAADTSVVQMDTGEVDARSVDVMVAVVECDAEMNEVDAIGRSSVEPLVASVDALPEFKLVTIDVQDSESASLSENCDQSAVGDLAVSNKLVEFKSVVDTGVDSLLAVSEFNTQPVTVARLPEMESSTILSEMETMPTPVMMISDVTETKPTFISAVQTEPEIITGDTETTIVTGETEPEIITGDTETAIATGETEPEIVTGETETVIVTGETEPTIATGETEPEIIIGETETVIVTGETEPAIATGETETAIVTGETEPAIATGETEPVIATGETEPAIATGETEPVIATGETETAIVTGETEPAIATGETEPVIATGETEPEIIAGESGETEPDIVAGDTEATIVTGDTEPEIVTGDTEAAIITGDTEPTIVTGETELAIVTGETESTIVTGETEAQSTAIISGTETTTTTLRSGLELELEPAAIISGSVTSSTFILGVQTEPVAIMSEPEVQLTAVITGTEVEPAIILGPETEPNTAMCESDLSDVVDSEQPITSDPAETAADTSTSTMCESELQPPPFMSDVVDSEQPIIVDLAETTADTAVCESGLQLVAVVGTGTTDADMTVDSEPEAEQTTASDILYTESQTISIDSTTINTVTAADMATTPTPTSGVYLTAGIIETRHTLESDSLGVEQGSGEHLIEAVINVSSNSFQVETEPTCVLSDNDSEQSECCDLLVDVGPDPALSCEVTRMDDATTKPDETGLDVAAECFTPVGLSDASTSASTKTDRVVDSMTIENSLDAVDTVMSDVVRDKCDGLNVDVDFGNEMQSEMVDVKQSGVDVMVSDNEEIIPTEVITVDHESSPTTEVPDNDEEISQVSVSANASTLTDVADEITTVTVAAGCGLEEEVVLSQDCISQSSNAEQKFLPHSQTSISSNFHLFLEMSQEPSLARSVGYGAGAGEVDQVTSLDLDELEESSSENGENLQLCVEKTQEPGLSGIADHVLVDHDNISAASVNQDSNPPTNEDGIRDAYEETMLPSECDQSDMKQVSVTTCCPVDSSAEIETELTSSYSSQLSVDGNKVDVSSDCTAAAVSITELGAHCSFAVDPELVSNVEITEVEPAAVGNSGVSTPESVSSSAVMAAESEMAEEKSVIDIEIPNVIRPHEMCSETSCSFVANANIVSSNDLSEEPSCGLGLTSICNFVAASSDVADVELVCSSDAEDHLVHTGLSETLESDVDASLVPAQMNREDQDSTSDTVAVFEVIADNKAMPSDAAIPDALASEEALMFDEETSLGIAPPLMGCTGTGTTEVESVLAAADSPLVMSASGVDSCLLENDTSVLPVGELHDTCGDVAVSTPVADYEAANVGVDVEENVVERPETDTGPKVTEVASNIADVFPHLSGCEMAVPSQSGNEIQVSTMSADVAVDSVSAVASQVDATNQSEAELSIGCNKTVADGKVSSPGSSTEDGQFDDVDSDEEVETLSSIRSIATPAGWVHTPATSSSLLSPVNCSVKSGSLPSSPVSRHSTQSLLSRTVGRPTSKLVSNIRSRQLPFDIRTTSASGYLQSPTAQRSLTLSHLESALARAASASNQLESPVSRRLLALSHLKSSLPRAADTSNQLESPAAQRSLALSRLESSLAQAVSITNQPESMPGTVSHHESHAAVASSQPESSAVPAESRKRKHSAADSEKTIKRSFIDNFALSSDAGFSNEDLGSCDDLATEQLASGSFSRLNETTPGLSVSHQEATASECFKLTEEDSTSVLPAAEPDIFVNDVVINGLECSERMETADKDHIADVVDSISCVDGTADAAINCTILSEDHAEVTQTKCSVDSTVADAGGIDGIKLDAAHQDPSSDVDVVIHDESAFPTVLTGSEELAEKNLPFESQLSVVETLKLSSLHSSVVQESLKCLPAESDFMLSCSHPAATDMSDNYASNLPLSSDTIEPDSVSAMEDVRDEHSNTDEKGQPAETSSIAVSGSGIVDRELNRAEVCKEESLPGKADENVELSSSCAVEDEEVTMFEEQTVTSDVDSANCTHHTKQTEATQDLFSQICDQTMSDGTDLSETESARTDEVLNVKAVNCSFDDILCSQCVSQPTEQEKDLQPLSQSSVNSDAENLHLFLEMSQVPNGATVSELLSHEMVSACEIIPELSELEKTNVDDNLQLFLEMTQEPSLTSETCQKLEEEGNREVLQLHEQSGSSENVVEQVAVDEELINERITKESRGLSSQETVSGRQMDGAESDTGLSSQETVTGRLSCPEHHVVSSSDETFCGGIDLTDDSIEHGELSQPTGGEEEVNELRAELGDKPDYMTTGTWSSSQETCGEMELELEVGRSVERSQDIAVIELSDGKADDDASPELHLQIELTQETNKLKDVDVLAVEANLCKDEDKDLKADEEEFVELIADDEESLRANIEVMSCAEVNLEAARQGAVEMGAALGLHDERSSDRLDKDEVCLEVNSGGCVEMEESETVCPAEQLLSASPTPQQQHVDDDYILAGSADLDKNCDILAADNEPPDVVYKPVKTDDQDKDQEIESCPLEVIVDNERREVNAVNDVEAFAEFNSECERVEIGGAQQKAVVPDAEYRLLDMADHPEHIEAVHGDALTGSVEKVTEQQVEESEIKLMQPPSATEVSIPPTAADPDLPQTVNDNVDDETDRSDAWKTLYEMISEEDRLPVVDKSVDAHSLRSVAAAGGHEEPDSSDDEDNDSKRASSGQNCSGDISSKRFPVSDNISDSHVSNEGTEQFVGESPQPDIANVNYIEPDKDHKEHVADSDKQTLFNSSEIVSKVHRDLDETDSISSDDDEADDGVIVLSDNNDAVIEPTLNKMMDDQVRSGSEVFSADDHVVDIADESDSTESIADDNDDETQSDVECDIGVKVVENSRLGLNEVPPVEKISSAVLDTCPNPQIDDDDRTQSDVEFDPVIKVVENSLKCGPPVEDCSLSDTHPNPQIGRIVQVRPDVEFDLAVTLVDSSRASHFDSDTRADDVSVPDVVTAGPWTGDDCGTSFVDHCYANLEHEQVAVEDLETGDEEIENAAVVCVSAVSEVQCTVEHGGSPEGGKDAAKANLTYVRSTSPEFDEVILTDASDDNEGVDDDNSSIDIPFKSEMDFSDNESFSPPAVDWNLIDSLSQQNDVENNELELTVTDQPCSSLLSNQNAPSADGGMHGISNTPTAVEMLSADLSDSQLSAEIPIVENEMPLTSLLRLMGKDADNLVQNEGHTPRCSERKLSRKRLRVSSTDEKIPKQSPKRLHRTYSPEFLPDETVVVLSDHPDNENSRSPVHEGNPGSVNNVDSLLQNSSLGFADSYNCTPSLYSQDSNIGSSQACTQSTGRRRRILQKIREKREMNIDNESLSNDAASSAELSTNSADVTSQTAADLIPQELSGNIESLQETHRSIVSELRQILRCNSVVSDQRIQSWRQTITAMAAESSLPATVIAVVGDTGSGKSSLLNALLGHANILPTSGMRACTAVVVRVSSNVASSNQFEADIEFLTEPEWMDELELLLKELTGRNGKVRSQQPDVESAGLIAWSKIRAVYGSFSSDVTLEHLRQQRRVTRWLGKTQQIKVSSATEFQKAVHKYIESRDVGDGGDYWPIVKHVSIRLPNCDVCSSGAILVDLPGVGDSNAARDKIAKNYLKSCNAVWVVSSIHRAVNDKTARDLLGEHFRRQLLMDGQYGSISFICSKTDILNPSEIISDLKLEERSESIQSEIAVLETCVEEVQASAADSKHRIKVLKSELDKLSKKASLLTTDVDELTQVLTVESDDEEEEVAEEEVHSVLSNTERDLGVTREAIAAKTVQIHEAESREKDCKKQINELKTKIGKQRKALMEMCALARNNYSRRQISRDFRAGMKQMRRRANQSTDDADDDDDDYSDSEDSDIDDINRTAANLKVFCCSSTEYLKLQGQLHKDGPSQVFCDVKDTGIPDVISFVHTMTKVRRRQGIERVIQKLAQFVLDVAGYLVELGSQDRNVGTDAKNLFDSHLSDLSEKIFPPIVKHTISQINSLFSNSLSPRINDGVKQASSTALATATKWGSKVNRENRSTGGLCWSTYRATTYRNGSFKSPTAGLIDFNADLSGPLYTNISVVWDRIFNLQMVAILDDFKATVLRSIQQFCDELHRDLLTVNVSKDCLERTRRQQTSTAATRLSELINKLKELVMDQQRDISRVLTPAVQNKMIPGYEACNNDAGPGVYERMKTNMAKHISVSKDFMFIEASDQLLDRLIVLQNDIEMQLNEACGVVIGDIIALYEPIWETPVDSRASRNQLVSDILRLKGQIVSLYTSAGLDSDSSEIEALNRLEEEQRQALVLSSSQSSKLSTASFKCLKISPAAYGMPDRFGGTCAVNKSEMVAVNNPLVLSSGQKSGLEQKTAAAVGSLVAKNKSRHVSQSSPTPMTSPCGISPPSMNEPFVMPEARGSASKRSKSHTSPSHLVSSQSQRRLPCSVPQSSSGPGNRGSAASTRSPGARVSLLPLSTICSPQTSVKSEPPSNTIVKLEPGLAIGGRKRKSTLDIPVIDLTLDSDDE